MKKLVFLGVLIGLIFFGFTNLEKFPFHFYKKTLSEGISSEYLNLPASPQSFFQGNLESFEKDEVLESNIGGLWRVLHFDNFLMAFPERHSRYRVFPKLEKKKEKIYFGIELKNSKNIKISEFIVIKKTRYEYSFLKNKIFSFPIFKNYILKKNQKEIWRDIFSKKLEIKNYSFEQTKELVYNLFILGLRRSIFPKNTKK